MKLDFKDPKTIIAALAAVGVCVGGATIAGEGFSITVTTCLAAEEAPPVEEAEEAPPVEDLEEAIEGGS